MAFSRLGVHPAAVPSIPVAVRADEIDDPTAAGASRRLAADVPADGRLAVNIGWKADPEPPAERVAARGPPRAGAMITAIRGIMMADRRFEG
jgi:hypothetical protein